MGQIRLLLAASLLLGAAAGIGSFTFVYAKGGSYLSDNPAACSNCHVMGDHYAAWMKSSHRDVATCNDCHTPPGLVPKYVNKASNGFWHSVGFTTGNFPDPLRITERNSRVTELACRECHEPLVAAIEAGHGEVGEPVEREGISCVKCHATVGHWVR